ncbi:hypothetical protein [Streptomyces sp. NPDC051001]|uniref:hypothetical protein n=1 Tax=Streptomyces sp. NPDC051001 TaxID=3155795 RepID=UPI00342218B1
MKPIWLAILGTAYGVAVQAEQYGLAGSLGVIAAVSVAVTDLETTRLRASAQLAAEAVTELQGRLADALSLEAMRLDQREQAGRPPTPTLLGLDSGRWVAFVSIAVRSRAPCARGWPCPSDVVATKLRGLGGDRRMRLARR